MYRPGVRPVPVGSGEQGKMEETGCEIICGALTTLAVKGNTFQSILHHEQELGPIGTKLSSLLMK